MRGQRIRARASLFPDDLSAKLAQPRLDRCGADADHPPKPTKEDSMVFALMGYVHVAIAARLRAIRALAEGQRGQGTVEYVGLILLVSLLMVGMVAAMKGFNGKQGTELAEVIIERIKAAVNKVTFK
jgi:hypothetical protein